MILSLLGAFSPPPSEFDSAACAGVSAAAICVPITAAAVAAAPFRNARRSKASLPMTYLRQPSSILASQLILELNYQPDPTVRASSGIDGSRNRALLSMDTLARMAAKTQSKSPRGDRRQDG